ncbi:hypothetical protein [Moritella yayanosii]|uniref:Lipoprotein n=1 Tax=Moritella yayanosii TaxID=69539 RepID=A0A330LV56_9GAMM|nr:hypothetical protein [Moritella yayanosii]SQD77915.1 conserved protein of unknown function [Moritella yayanosii]
MIHLAKVIINSNVLKTYCKTYFPSYIERHLWPTSMSSLRRYVLLLLMMCFSLSVRAESVENDKQQHFIAETVICGTTMMYTESWWQTMLVGLSVGALKETYDAGQEGNEFSKNDMVANLLGCIAGISYGATVLHFHYESETDTTIIGIEGKF